MSSRCLSDKVVLTDFLALSPDAVNRSVKEAWTAVCMESAAE